MKYFSHGSDICKIAVKWFYGVMVSTQDSYLKTIIEFFYPPFLLFIIL